MPNYRSIRALVVGLAAAWELTTAPALGGQQTKPIDPANMDTTCLPCTDFFKFANGGWLARASIPGDLPGWGSFNELQESNFAALKDVLTAAQSEAKTSPKPAIRMLGTFYGTCMDSVRADADGAKPLGVELKRVAGIKTRADLQSVFARFQRLEIFAPFVFHSTPDAKNSSRVIAEAYQGGLGMPDRDYYTKADSASQTLRDKYLDHVGRMFRLLGDDSVKAAAGARTVMGLETALAQASMTRVERRNPDAVYNLKTVAELQQLAPTIGWGRFFGDLGLANIDVVNLGQPKFLEAMDSLFQAAPIADWKTYLRWHLLTATAADLSTPFVTEDFRFRQTVLRGVSEMRPRWKRCLTNSDNAVGEILGQAFVEKKFTPEAKARALEMVKNVLAEFRSRLAQVDWMSEETKTKAYAKLDAIVNKIGYPDTWRDYSALKVSEGPFVLNDMSASEFDYQRDLAKIGKPVDKTEWGMTPPTVNAYYNPLYNEIVFPAGIMQPPFFNPDADDAVNYGGMGAVIGHEMTHGFDDQGRQFDAQGNLSGWWSPEDGTEFVKRADVVAKQFDGYVAIDSLHVNGKLTLGENIADFGGLTTAFGAYRRSLAGKPEPAPIDGFTGDQRFFLAWAQVWRQVRRPEYVKLLVNTDPHAPGPYRTNGPLSNMPEFAKAFGCKAGDPMVRDQLAKIW